MGDLATDAAALFGVALTPEQTEQFDIYARELAAWNAHINLTAITDEAGVRVRHFLDSLSLVLAVPALLQPDISNGLRVIDVGTGAGFPGLALAIAFPQLHVTLLEATGKKVAFLEHVIDTLGLINAEPLNARAEDAGQMRDQRSAYQVVVARAVARLPSLLEYLLPLATVGGLCIAMKGRTAQQEADDSKRALKTLHGKLRDIVTVELPDLDEPHYLVCVEKVAPTPAAYPRKPGVPTQKPIV